MKSLEAFREIDPGPARTDGLSRAIGWSSVGAGVAQLAAPIAIARAIGLEPSGRASLAGRIMGLANLAIGAGLLLRPRRASRMWARLAGDAVGVGLLASAAGRASDTRVATALAASGTVLVLDAIAARRLSRARRAPAPLAFAVTINKPPADVYAFFRRFENLPRFMDYLESVEERGQRRSHWTARLPLGAAIEWDAEIVEDRMGELIEWRTVEGSMFAHRGTVTFATAPGGSCIVSILGVYAGFMDKFPIGPLMNRGITIRTGQCHVHRYMRPLLERIERGDIDPSFVVSHHMKLDDAAEAYEMFMEKRDDAMKIVLRA